MTSFTFDIRTAYLIGCLMYIGLPLVAWGVLKPYQSTATSVWCGGSLMFGVGWLLLAVLRGIVPDLLSYPVANILIFWSFLLRAQALHACFLGQVHWEKSLTASLVYMAGFEVLRHFDEVGHVRVAFATICLVGALIYFTGTAWQLGRKHNSASLRWLGRIYGLATLSGLWRVSAVIAQLVGYSPLSDQDTAYHIIGGNLNIYTLAVCLILSAVIGHICFFGVVLEDALKHRTDSAARLAREEETNRFAIQLALFDRQSGIAELSSSFAHELTQPLTAILSNVQTAKRGIKGGRMEYPQLAELLGRIEVNSRRANEIVKRIRSFIRPHSVERVALDLTAIGQETVDLIRHDANSKLVDVVVVAPREPVPVIGDAVQLSQVILNLCRNAMDALATQQENALARVAVTIAVLNDKATLTIADNGPGLTEAGLVQAGTAFFSTKPGGLGMGLAISQAILAQHGGEMTFRNAKSGGAVFEISLPLHRGTPEGRV
ncbi:hypothetical protein CU669_11595 [Paramagnetospirillum kuznetsovii]|uniref:histidine kinase n=1 Tax=Paramagnetospirillum kuznetsovii TaxID=2053833 RepID=A0A364NXX4_9PROT|nr:HAMP domain-containing sensor histidine kinase [Paramagnetospirillum kuznetsovii]RAU21931.1 hypothetical protein CU669_11595 [Paramagnetospirillum kuznetsovii]